MMPLAAHRPIKKLPRIVLLYCDVLSPRNSSSVIRNGVAMIVILASIRGCAALSDTISYHSSFVVYMQYSGTK